MRSVLVLGIVAACDAGPKRPAPQPESPPRDRAAVPEPPLAPASQVAAAGVAVPRCEGEGVEPGCRRGRSAGTPTTSIGQPTLDGAIDKAIVRRRVKREIQKIMYCYEKSLLAKPELFGTVRVQFFISPTGEVQHVSASGVDPDVTSCVERVFEAMTFPASREGTNVMYPITFRPTGS